MPDKDIDKIPITVEVPKADVWVRNDYRDIVRRLGEVHMIRACEHQHDDDFVPLYDIETLARYQIELERLRADAERYRFLRTGTHWPCVFADHDALRIMWATLDKGHDYVLCVSPRDGGSTLRMDSGMKRIEIARMLERFARAAREDARFGGDE